MTQNQKQQLVIQGDVLCREELVCLIQLTERAIEATVADDLRSLIALGHLHAKLNRMMETSYSARRPSEARPDLSVLAMLADLIHPR
jgi:hypothetical protein